MKYLRSLNESYKIRDVEDFVRDHLAYLLDEGYDVIVGDSDENGGNTADKLEIYIYKKEDSQSTSTTTNFPTDVRNRVEVHPFLWNTITDHFLPFFHFLKREYVITQLYFLDINGRVWNSQNFADINTLQQTAPIDGIRIQIYNEILVDLLSRVYKKDNSYLTELHNDEEKSVWRVTKSGGKWRHYYIFYKNKFVTDRNNAVKVLKLSYNTQSSAHYNYIIHDNLCRQVEHGKLDVLLRQNGLNFGDFNDAWYYIENDYNNR